MYQTKAAFILKIDPPPPPIRDALLIKYYNIHIDTDTDIDTNTDTEDRHRPRTGIQTHWHIDRDRVYRLILLFSLKHSTVSKATVIATSPTRCVSLERTSPIWSPVRWSAGLRWPVDTSVSTWQATGTSLCVKWRCTLTCTRYCISIHSTFDIRLYHFVWSEGVLWPVLGIVLASTPLLISDYITLCEVKVYSDLY